MSVFLKIFVGELNVQVWVKERKRKKKKKVDPISLVGNLQIVVQQRKMPLAVGRVGGSGMYPAAGLRRGYPAGCQLFLFSCIHFPTKKIVFLNRTSAKCNEHNSSEMYNSNRDEQ